MTVGDRLDDGEPEARNRACRGTRRSGRTGRRRAAGPPRRCRGPGRRPSRCRCLSSTVTCAALGAPLRRVVEQVGDARSRAAASPVTHHGSVRTTNSTVGRPPAHAGHGLLDDGGELDRLDRGRCCRAPRGPARRGRRSSVVISRDLRAHVVQQLLARLLGDSAAEASACASRSRLVRSEVSGVRSSCPASATSCRCRCLRGGQRSEHRVERVRQPGDLVVALDRDRVEPLGARDVLDGGGEPAYRAQAVARHAPSPASPALIIPASPKSSITRPSRSSIWSVDSSDCARIRAWPSLTRAPPPRGSAARRGRSCEPTRLAGPGRPATSAARWR